MRLIRTIALALLGVVAVVWTVAWLRPDLLAALRGTAGGITVPGSIAVGGPFALTDQNGTKVTEQTYRGKWMLVYFGYTFCPDVCPTELQTISNALDLLGPDATKIVPIFITVDPGRDTVTALAEYVKLFDPRLIGLTGSEAETGAAARAYRVYYAKATTKDASNYLMDHSSFVYLMGPDGGFKSLFRQGIPAEEMAKSLRAKMAGT